MAKSKILYLCHRIPYPPNKGDKIRSFNLLKALSEQYEVHLGCFIDDDFDYQYIDKLAQWCVEYKCRPQKKWRAKLKGLTSFFTGQPITIPYYSDVQLQRWVDYTLEEYQIDTVVIFSSSMAQFVDKPQYSNLHRVLDFVDVDSDKWRQYADNHDGLMRWIYQREHKLLQKSEQHYCERFDHSLFVSQNEAKLFQELMPEHLSEKIHPLLNGVDIDFFSPDYSLSIESPNLPPQYLVFTGAMDYWANVDAVQWFADEVWPTLMATNPELKFVIVGGNPTAAVKLLAKRPNILVTGRVEDVRPYILNARFVVAPLRIARGIQNKVLEAMAMNKIVVATDMAMEGINAPISGWLRQSDDASGFILHCQALIATPDQICEARAWIIDHFTWQATLLPLVGWIHR
ncbi:MAG: TIGR03087 family PEP-CTERM/XrtA system glycosyltransferase [Alphaproteobacteria bacterium]|nr:TIGR03087 family PEP-CTERM/XrtA system glycosyltransferase [Alphaproteobacteria bacterium]